MLAVNPGAPADVDPGLRGDLMRRVGSERVSQT